MIIICTKVFLNLSMYNKVMDRTQTGLTGLCTKFKSDCDVDLRPSDMVLVHDIFSCHDDHLC